MKNLYWLSTCPFCKQGRLFVFRNLNKQILYLHCEECERGFNNPYNLTKESAFLTLLEDFESEEASMEDIINYGWEKLSLKQENEL